MSVLVLDPCIVLGSCSGVRNLFSIADSGLTFLSCLLLIFVGPVDNRFEGLVVLLINEDQPPIYTPHPCC